MQRGFTLIELVIAIAISGILIVGTSAMLRILVVNSATATDQAVANLQVHYTDYWISQDVVQAGNLTPSNDSAKGKFPLIIVVPGNVTWGGNFTVIYDVEDMTDKLENNLWRLYRTKIDVNGANSTSMIAEYLLPWSDIPIEEANGSQGTRCYIDGNITANEDRLILQVAALVDESVAESIYEIYPRISPDMGNFTE